MQKIIVNSLLAILLVPGTSAFAQFKSPAKTVENLISLQKIIARASRPSAVGRQVVPVPAGLIENNKIALTGVSVPTRMTPVNKSLDFYIRQGAESMQLLADSDVRKKLSQMPGQWVAGGGKAFYADQTQLARDLDAFYKGNTHVLVGPDGREVKLYALPVDNILYRAPGYKIPVVLNAQDYFVIYDIQSKTGRLAGNTPLVYNLYKPRMYDEIWKGMDSDKVFDDLNNLCDAVLLAHLHQARVNKLRGLGVTANTVSIVKTNKAIVQKQLNHQEELLAYLQQLPQVRETTKGFKAYVVELPVDGLSWTDSRDGTTHHYSRREHVMLFFEMGSVGIYPRADVENPAFFTPVK